jgi:hypothetical protein
MILDIQRWISNSHQAVTLKSTNSPNSSLFALSASFLHPLILGGNTASTGDPDTAALEKSSGG